MNKMKTFFWFLWNLMPIISHHSLNFWTILSMRTVCCIFTYISVWTHFALMRSKCLPFSTEVWDLGYTLLFNFYFTATYMWGWQWHDAGLWISGCDFFWVTWTFTSICPGVRHGNQQPIRKQRFQRQTKWTEMCQVQMWRGFQRRRLPRYQICNL